MLIDRKFDEAIQRVPGWEDTSVKVSHAIHAGVLKGGAPTRTIADVLHGTFIGHPLHPLLTDVTVGGWIFGSLFDLLWLVTKERKYARIADVMIRIGTASAVPTALAGLADFQAIPERAAGTGLLHAILNVTNLALFGTSLILRKNGNRKAGAILSVTAMVTSTVAAWVGGHLSYGQRVGMDHDQPVDALLEWTAVMPLKELPPGTPHRLDVQGRPVLLYIADGEICAISAVCSHDGGPLNEGKFTDGCVECPWHQSVFNLRDGAVVHGPSTYPVTNYQTRIRDGQIELRLETARK